MSCCGMLALTAAVVLGDSPNTLSKMSRKEGKEKFPEGCGNVSVLFFAGRSGLALAAAAPRYIVVIVATGLWLQKTQDFGN